MSIEVRRGDERGLSTTAWLRSRHSFSYGSYYDPNNIAFGVLSACNEDELAAGTGFDAHPHRDVEIVTWMISGALRHTDDEQASAAGNVQVLTAGMAQHLGAGSGVIHAEQATTAGTARYIQMWVRPSATALRPVYAAHDFTAALDAGGWVALASGLPDSPAPLRLRQLDAELRAIRLAAGDRTRLPIADFVHAQLTGGQVSLAAAGDLRAGDALRVAGQTPVSVTANRPAELLVWMMYAQ